MTKIEGVWVVLTMSTLLLACAPEEAPPTAGDILAEGVDMAFIQMRTFMTREGIRRARIEGDTAESRNETEMHLRPVTLTFFDVNGRESTVLTADYGIYHEITEDMEAEGSVVAINSADGQRLETERLRYVNAEDRLFGDVAFRLYRDGGATIIDGLAFESDPALDSVIVLAPSGQTERPVVPTAAQTPAPAAVDSGAAVDDAAAVDSVAVVVDSAATQDTTVMPSDSAAVVDTTRTPADSVSSDSVVAPPDTSRIGWRSNR